MKTEEASPRWDRRRFLRTSALGAAALPATLIGDNQRRLAPGMTFSDEPGIYIPGEFGVRLEDDMHITKEGARWFTPQSPSIEQPFG
jgi:Xaa-Pro aminopeptidase